MDWIRKIDAAASADLRPGENVKVAIFMQPSGTVATTVARAIGGTIGAGFVRRRHEPLTASHDWAAAKMPAGRVVAGITSVRILVWSLGRYGTTPRSPGVTLGAGELETIGLQRRRADFLATFTFHDGSTAQYETPAVIDDPDRFVTAFTELARSR